MSGRIKNDITDADMEPFPFDEDRHWPEWEDMLGRTFRPGDLVAVGITAGRSASLSVGVVRKINKLDSSGKPIMRSAGTGHSIEDKNAWGGTRWISDPPVPHCTVTFRTLAVSANRYGASSRDSTVSPDKIVLLSDVSIADVL